MLAARAMPVEGKRKLAATGTALDADLNALLEWMHSLDAGLGRSADTAASKMRYQMNRLRRLAANFQLQREDSLGRHAEAICQSLYPAESCRSGSTAPLTTLPATASNWRRR